MQAAIGAPHGTHHCRQALGMAYRARSRSPSLVCGQAAAAMTAATVAAAVVVAFTAAAATVAAQGLRGMDPPLAVWSAAAAPLTLSFFPLPVSIRFPRPPPQYTSGTSATQPPPPKKWKEQERGRCIIRHVARNCVSGRVLIVFPSLGCALPQKSIGGLKSNPRDEDTSCATGPPRPRDSRARQGPRDVTRVHESRRSASRRLTCHATGDWLSATGLPPISAAGSLWSTHHPSRGSGGGWPPFRTPAPCWRQPAGALRPTLQPPVAASRGPAHPPPHPLPQT